MVSADGGECGDANAEAEQAEAQMEGQTEQSPHFGGFRIEAQYLKIIHKTSIFNFAVLFDISCNSFVLNELKGFKYQYEIKVCLISI